MMDMLVTILLWLGGSYLTIGLLCACFLALIAHGQGDPLSPLKFAGFILKWPAVMWGIVGP